MGTVLITWRFIPNDRYCSNLLIIHSVTKIQLIIDRNTAVKMRQFDTGPQTHTILQNTRKNAPIGYESNNGRLTIYCHTECCNHDIKESARNK